MATRRCLPVESAALKCSRVTPATLIGALEIMARCRAMIVSSTMKLGRLGAAADPRFVLGGGRAQQRCEL